MPTIAEVQDTAKDNILKAIRDYFGMSAKDMVKEWKALTDQDKNQIKAGLLDGTETY